MLIFVCSPLRGDIKRNQLRACGYAREIALNGDIPIVPHIYFTQFLDELNDSERELGIKSGIELLKLCDKMYVYGDPTEGMKQEIAAFDGTIERKEIKEWTF